MGTDQKEKGKNGRVTLAALYDDSRKKLDRRRDVSKGFLKVLRKECGNGKDKKSASNGDRLMKMIWDSSKDLIAEYTQE